MGPNFIYLRGLFPDAGDYLEFLAYNTFAVSVLGFIAQLEPLPPWAPKEEERGLRRAIVGPDDQSELTRGVQLRNNAPNDIGACADIVRRVY